MFLNFGRMYALLTRSEGKEELDKFVLDVRPTIGEKLRGLKEFCRFLTNF